MSKLKNLSFKQSTNLLRKTGLLIGTSLLIGGLVSCGSTEYDEQVTLTPTQGVVTEVKEMERDLFRITDETIVAAPADSRIIAEYLDGQRDTFTLEEARLVDADNPKRRYINNIAMMGMVGYMMSGRSMNSGVSQGAYANKAAYQKSQASSSTMRSSAKRNVVRTPKKGFGSSKSTRSYGG